MCSASNFKKGAITIQEKTHSLSKPLDSVTLPLFLISCQHHKSSQIFCFFSYIFLVIMRFASHREIYHDMRQLGIDPFTLMSLTAAQFLLIRYHFVDGHFVAKFMTDSVPTSSSKCTSQKSFFGTGIPYKVCHVNLESHLCQKEMRDAMPEAMLPHLQYFSSSKEGKYLISSTLERSQNFEEFPNGSKIFKINYTTLETTWKTFHHEWEIINVISYEN